MEWRIEGSRCVWYIPFSSCPLMNFLFRCLYVQVLSIWSSFLPCVDSAQMQNMIALFWWALLDHLPSGPCDLYQSSAAERALSTLLSPWGLAKEALSTNTPGAIVTMNSERQKGKNHFSALPSSRLTTRLLLFGSDCMCPSAIEHLRPQVNVPTLQKWVRPR